MVAAVVLLYLLLVGWLGFRLGRFCQSALDQYDECGDQDVFAAWVFAWVDRLRRI